MIFFLTSQGFGHTLEPLLELWSPSLAARFEFISYEEMSSFSELAAGTYVFADLERLSADELGLAGQVRASIKAQLPHCIVLNDPERTLCRFELLTELHRRGLNPFQAHRLSETTTANRFPVFLRYEHEHTGATSGLLNSQDELDRAIVRALVRGHSLRELLIAEFCDTRSDDGLFRKYGAFVVGDRILPRHLFFDREWVVKYPGLRDESKISEELEYIHANPHEQELREIARLAGIEYGRIDYSVLEGRIVTWEINTNPYAISPPDQVAPESLPRQKVFVRQVTEAFEAIDNCERDVGRVVLPSLLEPVPGRSSRARPVRDLMRRKKKTLSPLLAGVEFFAVAFRRPILALWKRRIASPTSSLK